MLIAFAVLWSAGLVPFAIAWKANRATTLRHALAWAVAAWLVWGVTLAGSASVTDDAEPSCYVALCLTAAAGVASLESRKRNVIAWSFVVVGLLAVMLLPFFENLVIGTRPADGLRVFFLLTTLAVGLLNYLPTRAAPAVMLLGAALGGELLTLFAPNALPALRLTSLFHLMVLLSPWGAWACWRGGKSGRSQFDRLWLDFRDHVGLFWAQRVREQFNRAADNAGWPVHLAWRGLHRSVRGVAIVPEEEAAMLDTLRAATQRFGTSDQRGP